jgi:phage tail-like protein
MAKSTVTPRRFDPYKNFKFRVKWDGRVVADVSRVSALRRSTEIVSHRDGGDPTTSHTSPGRTSYEPITLERGITHDSEFAIWANLVWQSGAGSGSEANPASFRKDIVIELCNEAGRVLTAFKVYRCWVSAFQALPDLDAAANTTAIQSITLQHEGWERDPSVPESSTRAPRRIP